MESNKWHKWVQVMNIFDLICLHFIGTRPQKQMPTTTIILMVASGVQSTEGLFWPNGQLLTGTVGNYQKASQNTLSSLVRINILLFINWMYMYVYDKGKIYVRNNWNNFHSHMRSTVEPLVIHCSDFWWLAIIQNYQLALNFTLLKYEGEFSAE